MLGEDAGIRLVVLSAEVVHSLGVGLNDALEPGL